MDALGIWLQQKTCGRSWERYANDQLKKTALWAFARSRFYKRKLSGFDLENLSSAHLAQLPFTRPEDVAADPAAFLCLKPDEITRVVTMESSGSTGQAKKIFFSHEDQRLTIDYFCYGMRTILQKGQRCAIFLPGKNPGGVVDLLVKGLSAMGAEPLIYSSVQDLAAAWDFLRRERPHCLVGMPGQVLALARSREAAYGFRLPKILMSADYLPDSLAQTVSQAWQSEVYNHYGMTEMGYGGALSCTSSSHLHIRGADLYFEVVDPQSGGPVPAGEAGEIVFTTLTRLGMPLLRYRTGDTGRLQTKPCACGLPLPYLYDIEGRAENSVSWENHTLRQKDLDEALFALPSILDFQATVILGEQPQLRLQIYKNGQPLDCAELKHRLTPYWPSALPLGIEVLEQEQNLPCFLGKRMIKKEQL